jgi:hypothetical protein
MSIGPMAGIVGSAAGSSLAQTQGSETERAAQDAAAGQRRTESDQKADAAAGIGEANGEDHEAAERDADGRRLWEPPAEGEEEQAVEDAVPEDHKSRDPSGESGNLLDLSG